MSKSIWAAPLQANLRNFFFLFFLQKCQNRFGQGVLPIWEMPKRKSSFCLGSHPLVNGPISWGSTQTSYTCHGHRPCLGDIPFHKAPSFYKWQASPFSIFPVRSYVWTWTRVFFWGEMNKVLLCNTMKSNSLSNKPQ